MILHPTFNHKMILPGLEYRLYQLLVLPMLWISIVTFSFFPVRNVSCLPFVTDHNHSAHGRHIAGLLGVGKVVFELVTCEHCKRVVSVSFFLTWRF